MNDDDPQPELPPQRRDWPQLGCVAVILAGLWFIAVDQTLIGWLLVLAGIAATWLFTILHIRRRRADRAAFARDLEAWVQRQNGH